MFKMPSLSAQMLLPFALSALALTLSGTPRALAHAPEDGYAVDGEEIEREMQSDPEPVKLSQADAEAQIKAAGIKISSAGGCSDRSRPTCTSFEQINQSTISGVVTLKRASGCTMTIVGGTEVGHPSGTYSHWNGYKVDINRNSCVDDYIYRNFTYQGKRADGAPLYKSAAGNQYADEGSVWDITFF